MSLTFSTSLDSQSWDKFAAAAPNASLYHLHGWKDVIERTFGHPTFYLAAVDSGRVSGVLPLVQLKSRLFGNLLVSLPYFNYGGICAESADVRDALFREAVTLAERQDVDSLELRHDDRWREELPTKAHKVSMRLELPTSIDALWKALGAKLRNQVQKPRKAGVTITVGRAELLDSFYEVFSANMRDLGTPVYAKAFFRNILERFPDQTWIVTAYLDQRPVAAGFLTGFKDRLEIPWASSLRTVNSIGANMLLYWSCLEFAVQHGYRVFDFGRSTPGEGTYRFKEQWTKTERMVQIAGVGVRRRRGMGGRLGGGGGVRPTDSPGGHRRRRRGLARCGQGNASEAVNRIRSIAFGWCMSCGSVIGPPG
jgi:FemAB-related protein (PEP-CTERM system-associated)